MKRLWLKRTVAIIILSPILIPLSPFLLIGSLFHWAAHVIYEWIEGVE